MFRSSSLARLAGARFVRRFFVPAALVGLALLVTMQVAEARVHSLFSVFLAAVAISAYAGGWQAGLFASALSVITSDIFVLRPTWGTLISSPNHAVRLAASLLIEDRGDQIRLAAFSVTAAVICVLAALIERREHDLRGARQFLSVQQNEMEFLRSTGKIWSWEYDLITRRVSRTTMYNPVAMRRIEPVERWLDSIHPGDRERVRVALERALVDGNFEAEYRMLMGDSAPRRIIGHAMAYSLEGRVAGLRGIEIDYELRGSPVSPSA